MRVSEEETEYEEEEVKKREKGGAFELEEVWIRERKD